MIAATIRSPSYPLPGSHSLFSRLSFPFFSSVPFFLSPPTRAPSPLFSKRLISGAASQQEYLRKEKAPLFYSLFLTPLPYISLCSCLLLRSFFSHSLVFFIQDTLQCSILHNNHHACIHNGLCVSVSLSVWTGRAVVVFNYTAGELLLSHSN